MVLKQPKSLQEQSLHVLGMFITDIIMAFVRRFVDIDYFTCNNDARRCVELLISSVASYFDNIIPYHLHDSVMDQSLKCISSIAENDNCPLNMGFNYLVIALRSSARSFNLDNWSITLHPGLHDGLKKLSNLHHLQLCDTVNLFYLQVEEGVKSMKLLKSFKCRDCTYSIMKALSENCPLLKSLNLKHSPNITDLSLDFILKLKGLEVLNISDTNISGKQCKKILLGLPCLKSISCTTLPLGLAEIKDSSLKLSLKAVQFHCFAKEDIALVSKFCPHVTNIKMRPVEGIDLFGLSTLNNLTVFKFQYFTLYNYNFTTFLKSVGHSLSELCLCPLNLSAGNEISASKLIEINNLCPNVRVLKIKVNICSTDSSSISDRPIFQKLEFLEIRVKAHSHDGLLLIRCINGCTKLKTLIFSVDDSITDTEFKHIFFVDLFRHLEVFILKENFPSLRINTALEIITKAPQLKQLGYTSYLVQDNEELLQLREHVKTKNLDITLLDDY